MAEVSQEDPGGEKASGKTLGWWDWGSIALFALAAMFMANIVPDQGVGWDEVFHVQWGEQRLAFLASQLGFDSDAATAGGTLVHPAFFDTLGALVQRVSPLGTFSTRHFLSASFGLIGAFAVWLIGRRLGGAQLAFWCALLLLFMPRYFGHMSMNPKDIPFAGMFACALFFVVVAIEEYPRPSWRTLVGLGIFTGLALGVRTAGLLLPCYLGLFWGLRWLADFSRKPMWKEQASRALALALRGGIAALLALLVAFPWWPALWGLFGTEGDGRKSGNVAESLDYAQSFDWNAPVLFVDSVFLAQDLPFYYLPLWLLISVPAFMWLLLFAGAVLSGRRLSEIFSGKCAWDDRAWAILALAFAFVFPVAYVVVRDPIIYDGMRHFLFVLPPLAVLAALSLVSLQRALGTWKSRLMPAVPFLAGAGCVWIAVTLVQLHPLHYLYFNSFVGGLDGAYGRFETDYWSLSSREASKQLLTYLEDVSPGTSETHVYRVATSAHPYTVIPFVPRQFEVGVVTRIEDPHFYISTMRFDHHLFFRRRGRGQLVGYVRRGDAYLNTVWDLRGSAESAPLDMQEATVSF